MPHNILVITEKQGATKLQSLLDAIHEAIATGSFKPGDPLPSVNELSRMSGFSRDTIVKAYNILKQQSVIESTPAKGFYVSGSSFRVFMLLDDFSAFKEQLYKAFRENLPHEYSVDLLFHHYNPAVFEQLVRNAIGRYSMYVIMNLSNTRLHPVLSKIDPNRLLVLDMGSGDDPKINYLLQNFDVSVSECLEKGADLLKKYRELIFMYSRHKTPHPPDTEKAVRDFCHRHGLEIRVMADFEPEMMKPGQVYMPFTDNDLVQVLKGCRSQGLSLGSEVGILAYNDTPMKEIAGNGITVISVDFYEMGTKAAGFVKNKTRLQEYLSTRLMIRESL